MPTSSGLGQAHSEPRPGRGHCQDVWRAAEGPEGYQAVEYYFKYKTLAAAHTPASVRLMEWARPPLPHRKPRHAPGVGRHVPSLAARCRHPLSGGWAGGGAAGTRAIAEHYTVARPWPALHLPARSPLLPLWALGCSTEPTANVWPAVVGTCYGGGHRGQAGFEKALLVAKWLCV